MSNYQAVQLPVDRGQQISTTGLSVLITDEVCCPLLAEALLSSAF